MGTMSLYSCQRFEAAVVCLKAYRKNTEAAIPKRKNIWKQGLAPTDVLYISMI